MREETKDKRILLEEKGFIIGDRDPRLNQAFSGKFMIVEEFEESEVPTLDGSNGPWCIVGDNLEELIDTAYSCWIG